MIIFSCYIYTNNILYTVEIYNPHVPDQWHIIPHTSSVPSSMFQLIPKSRTNRSGRVKTPGQYYIIWIIKYRSSFKPTSKGRNKWKEKPNQHLYIPRASQSLEKQSWQSFHSTSSHCLRSSSNVGGGGGSSIQPQWRRGERKQKGTQRPEKCSWYTGGGEGWGFHSWAAVLGTSTIMNYSCAGWCNTHESRRGAFTVRCTPTEREQSAIFSRGFTAETKAPLSLWTGKRGCNPTQSSWRFPMWDRRTPL